MTMTHIEALKTLDTTYRQNHGLKLQNNTRLVMRGTAMNCDFGVILHGTEVVTIHSDGNYSLRSGGYHTITTSDRIRRYSPAKLFSIKGEFYLWTQPNPKDPRPARVERTVPKPYVAADPGPEPVKSTEDCVAGQIITTNHVNELVEIYRHDMRDRDVIEEVVSHGHGDDDKWDRVKVKRTWNSHVYIGEGAYWDQGWANLPDNNNVHSTSFVNDDGETVKYVQCAHCVEFDNIHEDWRQAMHGDRWHRRFDGANGYATYAAMMERFGTTEAWQEAYIEDFRARRVYTKADQEWEARNRVPFYEGITIDSEGYAYRLRQSGPSPAKLRRHEAEVARTKKRIDKYVTGYINALAKGMPMPGKGDCWYCAMSQSSDGTPMGDAMPTLHADGTTHIQPNYNHLRTHMEERYYVPSLAVNALRDGGKLTDTGIYIWLNMDPVRPSHGEEPARMIGTGKMGGGDKKQYDTVARAIRNYMRKRLVPEAPTS